MKHLHIPLASENGQKQLEMNFEIQGTLIVKNDTQVISDRFKKREFVIEKKESSPNGFEFVDINIE